MAATGEEPRHLHLTLGLVLAAFVALVAYWDIWFFVDRSWLANLNTQAYYVFENAFPAADAWLALACALGAWTLWKRRPSALFWLLAGGSASVYLGLMDVLFDLENGVYRAPLGDKGAVAVEIAINLYALGVGAWALRFGWRNRAWFLACTLTALVGCSSSSDKPPLLPAGSGSSAPICQIGDACQKGSYCWAIADSGCTFLTCGGSAWVCLPDAGPRPDASAPTDAGLDR